MWLQSLEANVHGFSLPTNASRNRMFLEAEVGRNMHSTAGDIRDRESVQRAFGLTRPEIVFHLAAQPLVAESYRTPAETFETNVMGTVNILDAVRRSPDVQSVVIVTTDKCYENRGWVWGYRETDRLGGDDPYSASKAAAELVTASYRKSFFSEAAQHVSIVSARAGNVIGGGDFTEGRLVPDVIAATQGGADCVLRNPTATRPWQHVLEPLSGYLALAERSVTEDADWGGAWNFGPSADDVATAQTVAQEVIDAWGSASKVIVQSANYHETALLALDSTKAKAKLGWTPRLRRLEAIEWTVEWAKRRADGEKVPAITVDQLVRYQTRNQL